MIQSGLTDLESDGLSDLEDGACDATGALVGPLGPIICNGLFDSPIGHWHAPGLTDQDPSMYLSPPGPLAPTLPPPPCIFLNSLAQKNVPALL